ncbi:hypothetical protein AJ80_09172 [Polytolypa hystricis UAMH7299]|uniref:Zn(2)-C6 fungal-type domain-containing protein n=1 Tax=Polytolypa hystricis (strain UAMH7299) TaxID=1447883 RepID=A0A2B7WVF4_POLH7|nr:hypothetical protein AJ80_09172 [Polytolypa hystricis UAMH7299]
MSAPVPAAAGPPAAADPASKPPVAQNTDVAPAPVSTPLAPIQTVTTPPISSIPETSNPPPPQPPPPTPTSIPTSAPPPASVPAPSQIPAPAPNHPTLVEQQHQQQQPNLTQHIPPQPSIPQPPSHPTISTPIQSIEHPPPPPPPQHEQYQQYNHGQGGHQSPGSASPMSILQYYPNMPPGASSPEAYQLTGDANQMLSGTRHKKEVKRRTKTGCLTCRKRRIKCDERHPVCRNCEKSKRDCMGYDPVFRPQPGPSAIQPAPSQQPPYQYTNQINYSYNTHPQNTPTTSTTSFIPPLPTTGSSASPTPLEQYNYGQSIDPILEGVASPKTSVANNSEGVQTPSSASAMFGSQGLELKPMGIDDLLSLRGHALPAVDVTTVPPARVEEIKMVFISYAMAIDRFLECQWFEPKGLAHLLSNPALLSHYSALLDGFNDRNIHNPDVLARVESRETHVIWDTMLLCRRAHSQQQQQQQQQQNGNSAPAPDPDLLFAVKRLSVYEALVTGNTLDTNPVALNTYPESDPAYKASGLVGQIKGRELQFWESIGRFVSVPTNDDPNLIREQDAALMISRSLLDTFENRDVIYSIAIVRQVARFQPKKLKPHPSSADEKDSGAKLYVACKFLESESRGGTNQVAKRLCGMVVKYWDEIGL